VIREAGLSPQPVRNRITTRKLIRIYFMEYLPENIVPGADILRIGIYGELW
jgi:hypothetical protein